jgi:hypothetical protein
MEGATRESISSKQKYSPWVKEAEPSVELLKGLTEVEISPGAGKWMGEIMF